MNEAPVAPPWPNLRRWLLVAGGLFLALLILRSLPSVLVDWLWFREVGYEAIFARRLITQAILGIGAGLLFAVLFVPNLQIALRSKPVNLQVVQEMQVVMPALRREGPPLRGIAWGAALVLAWILGQWAASHWLEVLQFLEAQPFGRDDPVFGADLAFHVFTLPAARIALGFLVLSLVFVSVSVVLAYVLQGRIWARPGFVSVDAGARRHLLLLLAVGLLVTAANDVLVRFDLLRSDRGIVSGAGHADVTAALPGLAIAAVVAGAGALVVTVEAFRKGLRLTIATLGAALVAHLALGEFWPAAIQRLVVAPNELEAERPYLTREIAETRFAYALEQVQEGQFSATQDLTAADVADNAATVENLRLWESEPLKTTNQQLQEIRTYYDFTDVDHDRYVIDGSIRQYALSPRELNAAALPSRTWINEHLTYTHGYGVCVATVNEISEEGLPVYHVKDLPPVSRHPELAIREPKIYYGELANEYVFVGTQAKEFDYPSGDENVWTTYEGRGGIPLEGFLGRLLFALHFLEPKILLSTDLTPGSRILLHRQVRERVSRIAPFLLWEGDPYLVIRADGTLSWMIDGYTITDRIPYSKPLAGVGNYIRNPVKAVVDAYHGSVTFYAVDEQDPLLATYEAVFPGTFAPGDSMPADLRAHMRYPEGLFAVQAEMYATYHMTDPQVFYNKEDLWKVANRSDGSRMAPYFTVTKLAGFGAGEEFILMLPFTPARKENLIAWMCARCDPPNYGSLVLFSFPKQRLIYGPQQIESRINQDTEISKELTLWNQQGSEVIRGNLLVVPVDSSLVYFQPLYLRASVERGLPELKRIVVAYGSRIAMESTMAAALERVFGAGASRPSAAATRLAARGGEEPGRATPGVDPRWREATDRYERAQAALRQGDLSAYAREIEALGELLRRAASP